MKIIEVSFRGVTLSYRPIIEGPFVTIPPQLFNTPLASLTHPPHTRTTMNSQEAIRAYYMAVYSLQEWIQAVQRDPAASDVDVVGLGTEMVKSLPVHSSSKP